MQHQTIFIHLARVRAMPYIVMSLLGLAIMFALACEVESGDRRPARRDDDKTGEFHRSPVTAFEQFRIDVSNTEEGCSSDPADITVSKGTRLNYAVQLIAENITTTGTGSAAMTGDRDKVTYQISGLAISASGGAFGPGVTEVDLELESGTRLSYSFSVEQAGAFDILCDGEKVGTFTVTE